MSALERRHARVPGPKLWCPGGCGNSVDHIGCEGEDGAVLIVLGREPYLFCGVACAAICLDELYRATYESDAMPSFMLLNTISEN